jgi:hypothetical protein
VATALTLNLLAFPYPVVGSLALRPFPWSRLVPLDELIAAPAAAFGALSPKLTSNDRVYFVYLHRNERGLCRGARAKPEHFRHGELRHEPQPALRQLLHAMRTGRQMGTW